MRARSIHLIDIPPLWQMLNWWRRCSIGCSCMFFISQTQMRDPPTPPSSKKVQELEKKERKRERKKKVRQASPLTQHRALQTGSSQEACAKHRCFSPPSPPPLVFPLLLSFSLSSSRSPSLLTLFAPRPEKDHSIGGDRRAVT